MPNTCASSAHPSSHEANSASANNSTVAAASDEPPDIRRYAPSNHTRQWIGTGVAKILALGALVNGVGATPFVVGGGGGGGAGSTSAHVLRSLLDTASSTIPNNTCLCTPTAEPSTGHSALFVVEAVMIPVLVVLSGILAGLTLGYMSLDTTQLQVLAKTGTPKQQRYAKRVIPLRKDGHILLISLLLANMIVNETLPVIADGVMGGGVQAVVISTVLIVIFAEIIPQSVCSRFGLQIGSAMVGPVQILIWTFYVVAWPVARLLNYTLGPHAGIVYRRAELKELISMHGHVGGHGGDLDQDTITIVGATLDLQTKTVQDAMTPMNQVFQLPLSAKLDYETLGAVLKAGHSRIPVYEEKGEGDNLKKRITGVLLTKQLILVDPEDGVALRDVPMNALPIVPEDLPLLQILNTFQEGRSHMAVVVRRKPGFNPILPSNSRTGQVYAAGSRDGASIVDSRETDMEKGQATGEQSLLRTLLHPKKYIHSMTSKEEEGKGSAMEGAVGVGGQQGFSMDARVSRSSLNALYFDEENPVGLITLEDVLEELIGEEIYDESDNVGGTREPWLEPFIPPEAVGRLGKATKSSNVKKKVDVATSTAIGEGGLERIPELSGSSGSETASSNGDEKEMIGLDDDDDDDDKDEKILFTPTSKPPPRSNATPPLSTPASTPLSTLSKTLVIPPSPSSRISRSQTPPIPGASGASGLGIPLTRPAPPLLSDAVLLERGRRVLISQGVDPQSLPNLRLAAPRSQPSSRSATPTGADRSHAAAGLGLGLGGGKEVVVPPPGLKSTSGPGVGMGQKKGSFKSPALPAPLPIRQSNATAILERNVERGGTGTTTSGQSTPTAASSPRQSQIKSKNGEEGTDDKEKGEKDEQGGGRE